MIARSWVVAFFCFAALAGCGGGVNSSGETENGPGAVLTQVVNPATGGTLVVNSTNNPLNGTVVTIPPNALGASAPDTVSIGYSDTLPGPINPTAVAAGAMVASKVIQLTHTSAAELAGSITVTIPYNTTAVGPNDVPVVLFWDEDINQYQELRVFSFDRTAGTITFRTHHFSSYIVAYINGLFSAISGVTSIPSPILTIDTGFRPETNGFAVLNFTSAYGVVSNGACYGLTAFAKWNFVNKKSPLFENYFGSTNPLRANPLEMDLQRDLIFATFETTYTQNETTFKDEASLFSTIPMSGWDSLTALELISLMLLTQSPQMLDIYQNRNPASPGASHSVLVYAWDSTQGFSIYDPNLPDTSQTVKFNWPTFLPYPSDSVTYALFAADSPSSYYSDGGLATLNANASSGSAYPFNVSISPGNTSELAPDGSFLVDPANGITITGSDSAANSSSQQPFAYFYENDVYVNKVSVVGGTFSMNLPPLPPGTGNQELLVIVAGSSLPYTSPVNQDGISSQYFGSARATLKPAGTSPSPGGFSNISLSCKLNADGSAQVAGLYTANLLPGEQILADAWPSLYLTGYTNDCQNPTFSGSPNGASYVSGAYLSATCTPSAGLTTDIFTQTNCYNPPSGQSSNVWVTVNTSVSNYYVSNGSMLMMLCRVPGSNGRPIVSIDTPVKCN